MRMTKFWLAMPVAVAIGATPIAWGQATEQTTQQQRQQQQQQETQRQQQMRAGQAGQQQEAEHLHKVRDLIGKTVKSQDNKTLGTIQHVYLDLSNSRAAGIAIKASGSDVQQIQDRTIIAPFHSLTRSDDQITLKVNADRLTKENTFEAGTRPDLTDRETFEKFNQTFNVVPYWKEKAQARREAMEAGRQMARQPVPPVFITRAATLMACLVTDAEGQPLGDLADVIIDGREGRLVYAVVALAPEGARDQDIQQSQQEHLQRLQQRVQQFREGQAMPPLSGRLAIVPWSVVNVQATDNLLVLETGDRQTLERLSFDAQQPPRLSDPQYATQIHRAFNQEPYWQVFGYGAEEPGAGMAPQPQQPMAPAAAGWEQYNRQYDAQRVQTVEGTITEISTFTPTPQAAPGLQAAVRTADGQTHIVHLGPASVMRQQDLQLAEGDRIRISGSQAQVQGQQVLIARQVQKGDQALLLRNEQGQPLWRPSGAAPGQQQPGR